MNNNFGIYDKSYKLITDLLQSTPEVEKACIFGSRAMGNYLKGSDIDIAIFGSNISYELILHLSTCLNQQLPIPYFIDIVHFETINNKKLKDHILDEGKEIKLIRMENSGTARST